MLSMKTLKQKDPRILKLVLVMLLIFAIVTSTFVSVIIYYSPRIIKPVPNLLVFDDGSLVQTEDDWNIRRQEVKEKIIETEYGSIPGRPDAINLTQISYQALTGGHSLTIYNITIIADNDTLSNAFDVRLWLYCPSGSGPFPAIVKVSPDGTGTQEPMNQTILNRGYVYACYDHTALDPDTKGHDIEGPCQQAYPGYSWGSLGVWAWGAMRIVDCLVNESWVNDTASLPEINADQLIVTGHSRRGKTALLAGVLDERIDMVVPNGSGCGGAGSFLIQGLGSETIALITSPHLYKSWFNEDFHQYACNERALDFDQHFMRALVAPRLILSTDGLGDDWANPIGTQAMYQASQPVFDLLGVLENNAIHYRLGGHGFLAEDFSVLLNFADKMLLGKSVSDEFYMTPYDFEVPIQG